MQKERGLRRATALVCLFAVGRRRGMECKKPNGGFEDPLISLGPQTLSLKYLCTMVGG